MKKPLRIMKKASNMHAMYFMLILTVLCKIHKVRIRAMTQWVRILVAQT